MKQSCKNCKSGAEIELEECCGTCKYHKANYNKVNDGTGFNNYTDWYCNNERSDYYTDFAEYEDWCEDWEERSR